MLLHMIGYGTTCSVHYGSIAGAATTAAATTAVAIQQRSATDEIFVHTSRAWTMAPGDCYLLFNLGWKSKLFKHINY